MKKPTIIYNYISYGGGRDSTALLLEWFDRDFPLYDIIFVDTGTEYQETHDLVSIMQQKALERGHRFIILSTDIYDHFIQTKQLPSRRFRSPCTIKFKTSPIKQYIRTKFNLKKLSPKRILCNAYLGINADEAHRATHTIRPLVEWGIGKNKVREICHSHLGYIPISSRCFICPFQTKSERFHALKSYYPELKRLVENYPKDKPADYPFLFLRDEIGNLELFCKSILPASPSCD